MKSKATSEVVRGPDLNPTSEVVRGRDLNLTLDAATSIRPPRPQLRIRTPRPLEAAVFDPTCKGVASVASGGAGVGERSELCGGDGERSELRGDGRSECGGAPEVS